MTQHQLILEYVKEWGSITPMDAFRDLGITKLATRIGELEKNGIGFEHTKETSKNRYGKKMTYCRYKLLTEGNNANVQG